MEMHKAGYVVKEKKTKCIMILIRFRAMLGTDNILELPFAKLNLTAKLIKNVFKKFELNLNNQSSLASFYFLHHIMSLPLVLYISSTVYSEQF